ncbi:MAG: cupin domain-containing protein, partial [Thermodesulfobacteriota bacterium]
APPPELLFALAGDGAWIAVAPGLERRGLFRSRGRGTAYLLRVAPGATIPDHEHRGVEHSYVLSGSITVEGQLCRAGDYHRAAAGTSHHAPHSEDGCVMLVVLEAAAAS